MPYDFGRFHWECKGFACGDEVVFLDTPTTHKLGLVKKIKGHVPPGKNGNVCIEIDGNQIWIYGSQVMPSKEAAEKQIKFNIKTNQHNYSGLGQPLASK